MHGQSRSTSISLPDLSGHSRGQLLQSGEDYLAYSDEQWHMAWEEQEEADRQRGFALVFKFLATRLSYSRPHISSRYYRGFARAMKKCQEHSLVAEEFREIAGEAEIASSMVFELAEQRHTDGP